MKSRIGRYAVGVDFSYLPDLSGEGEGEVWEYPPSSVLAGDVRSFL